MTSPQGEAASENARWQAELSRVLTGTALPQMKSSFAHILRNLENPNEITPDVKAAFGPVYQGAADTYNQQKNVLQEVVAQQAKTSTLPVSGLESGGSLARQAGELDTDYRRAVSTLRFQERAASMGDFQSLMAMLNQGVGSGLQLASGFGGASTGAIQGLSNQSQFGNILGGAVTGASMGSMGGLGLGTVIGGVIGAGAGALGYGA